LSNKSYDFQQLQKTKSYYYGLMGWDAETTWPTRETYKRLGLSDVADSLQKLGKLPSKIKG